MQECGPHLHLRLTQHCFFLPGPPNLGLSLQLMQVPQFCCSVQPWQSPHLPLFLVPAAFMMEIVSTYVHILDDSSLVALYIPIDTVPIFLTGLEPLLTTLGILCLSDSCTYYTRCVCVWCVCVWVHACMFVCVCTYF